MVSKDNSQFSYRDFIQVFHFLQVQDLLGNIKQIERFYISFSEDLAHDHLKNESHLLTIRHPFQV